MIENGKRESLILVSPTLQDSVRMKTSEKKLLFTILFPLGMFFLIFHKKSYVVI